MYSLSQPLFGLVMKRALSLQREIEGVELHFFTEKYLEKRTIAHKISV